MVEFGRGTFDSLTARHLSLPLLTRVGLRLIPWTPGLEMSSRAVVGSWLITSIFLGSFSRMLPNHPIHTDAIARIAGLLAQVIGAR